MGLGNQVSHRYGGNSNKKVRFFFLLMIGEGKAIEMVFQRTGFQAEF